MYLEYSDEAITHLKRKDKRLGEAIDLIGPIKREAGYYKLRRSGHTQRLAHVIPPSKDR